MKYKDAMKTAREADGCARVVRPHWAEGYWVFHNTQRLRHFRGTRIVDWKASAEDQAADDWEVL